MAMAVDAETLWAFIQVIMIDLVLAGDNAVVIGMAAAGLPASLRRKAIVYGIISATVMRIALAVVTTQLLAVAGAAREHSAVLVFGLALSIGLMGLAAAAIARLLNRHRWIAYIGLLVIVVVALRMIIQCAEELMPDTDAALVFGSGG